MTLLRHHRIRPLVNNITFKRDPDSLLTINDMLRACHEDFGMQPVDVWYKLGYVRKPHEYPYSPSNAYRLITLLRH